MRSGLSVLFAALRSGAWVSTRRLRIYGVTLVAMYFATFATIIVTSRNGLDFTGKPVGTDFSEVWTAGRLVLSGHPELPFDPAQHAQAQHQIFGPLPFFYGWHYPPYFLFVASGLALLPYLLALLVWQGLSLLLYMATVYRALPHRLTLLASAAFPGVFVNFGHGQNGFLTAGLMAGGLLLLERRPGWAGAVLGLLVYKPQFALIVPLALLAGGEWRALLAASGAAIALTAATLLAFGTAAWRAFFMNMPFTRRVVLESGATGWPKIQSAFSAVRMLGGSVQAAYAVQTVFAVAVLLAVAVLWRVRADFRLRSAALCSGALLTTPYCLDYDMMLLGPALAFYVAFALESGFRPWDRSVLAGIWISPLLARLAAQHMLLPLGLAAIAACFLFSCHRALGHARALPALGTA